MFLWKINQIWKTDDNISMDRTHSYKDLSSKLFQNSEKILSEFVENALGNELESLLETWNNNTEKNMNKFKWKHTLTKCERRNRYIVTIRETCKDIPTSGGSSFVVLQASAHTKDFCPITDLLNGTYIARCTVHEDMTNIQGIVDFVNFTAFTKKGKEMQKNIFGFPVISKLHSTKTTESSLSGFSNTFNRRTNRGNFWRGFTCIFNLKEKPQDLNNSHTPQGWGWQTVLIANQSAVFLNYFMCRKNISPIGRFKERRVIIR